MQVSSVMPSFGMSAKAVQPVVDEGKKQFNRLDGILSARNQRSDSFSRSAEGEGAPRSALNLTIEEIIEATNRVQPGGLR